MKTYARIQDGRVAEFLSTDTNVGTMFHPDLIWLDVSSVNGVAVGWDYDGLRFSQPTVSEPAARDLTLSDLQSQFMVLNSRLIALSNRS